MHHITKKMCIFVADLAVNSQKSCNLQPILMELTPKMA